MADRMDTVTLMNLLRPMPVHQRVATLRKLHNLSQAKLADETGVERGSVSSWEAEPGQDRAHAPGEEARDRMGYLFHVPAYVLTPDFGMQNFQQAGLGLPKAEQEVMNPPETPKVIAPEPSPAPAPAPQQAPNHLPEPKRQEATQQIVQGAMGLERRPILREREEVQRPEAKPQQIVQPSEAPEPEVKEVLPPPPGVTRIG